MEDKNLLKIIDFWLNTAKNETLYSRDILSKIDLKSPEVVDIIGPRRSGKSSVLKLLIKKINEQKGWLYINFEDPFFLENNQPQVIEELIEAYRAYYRNDLVYLFFDEIQNVTHWETAVRKLRDSGLYKIFITGSSSKLLSSELSTLLSGRHLSYRLLPLSFSEFLKFKQMEIKTAKDLANKEKEILKFFDEYLRQGGFPQIVLGGSEELLKQYYNDIVQKDIIKRYDVREKDTLEKLGVFLMSNAGKIISLASITKLYGLSRQIAATYLGYFQEGLIAFEIPQFSFKLKTQHRALKKIYAIDTGLANAVSFRFSEDKGRMLENAVALELQRRNKEIFYFKHPAGEADFVIKNKNNDYEIIQAVWNWNDSDIKKRELKGLELAAKTLPIKKLTILTYSTTSTEQLENHRVEILPVYEWMLTRGN